MLHAVCCVGGGGIIVIRHFDGMTTISDGAGYFVTNLLPVNWAPHTNQSYNFSPPVQLGLEAM